MKQCKCQHNNCSSDISCYSHEKGGAENLPAKAGDARNAGSDPWVRQIPWRRKWQLTPVFLPRKFHGQRSLRGYSLRGQKKLDTTEHISQISHQKIRNFLTCIKKRIKTINITARLHGQKSGVIGTGRTNVQNDTGHPSISGQLQGFRKLRGIFCFKDTMPSNPKSVNLNREQQHFFGTNSFMSCQNLFGNWRNGQQQQN